MKFKTQYNFKDIYVTCSGTFVEDVDKTTGEKIVVAGRRYTYEKKYNDKGKRYVVISGTEDVYNYIQSFKDDTDIYKIIKRLNGDISQLDKNKGFYADLSSIPRDFFEFSNKVEEGNAIFKSLPTDLKARFGNSVNEFMASIYNKDFESKLNDYLKEVNPRAYQSLVNSDQFSVKGGDNNE